MFSIEPVERSSMTYTSSPSDRSRSARCEPTKPAPPVIRTLIRPSFQSGVRSDPTSYCPRRNSMSIAVRMMMTMSR